MLPTSSVPNDKESNILTQRLRRNTARFVHKIQHIVFQRETAYVQANSIQKTTFVSPKMIYASWASSLSMKNAYSILLEENLSADLIKFSILSSENVNVSKIM